MTPLLRASKTRPRRPTIALAEPELASADRARTPDELVTRFSDEIWRFASAQIRNREDAEDVVMETFAAAFRHFGRLERAADQRSWLFAVARKKVADTLRRRYRRAERPLQEARLTVDPTPSPTESAARGALASLPDGQREVLTLKYVNGLSIEEIGRVMRRSTAATNSLLQRGRQSLREAIGWNGETDDLGQTR